MDVNPERLASHRPGWLLDELSYAGRENLDAEHVARYDAKEDASAAAEVALLESVGWAATLSSSSSAPGPGSSASPWRRPAPG
jgi:hypothetical protein